MTEQPTSNTEIEETPVVEQPKKTPDELLTECQAVAKSNADTIEALKIEYVRLSVEYRTKKSCKKAMKMVANMAKTSSLLEYHCALMNKLGQLQGVKGVMDRSKEIQDKESESVVGE